jgi:hypothetical protein
MTTPDETGPGYYSGNMAFLAHHHGIAHTDCWCGICEDAAKRRLFLAGEISQIALLSGFMHLCPDCGNKRCPRATFHENACTGSNSPGQPGSKYS